MTKSTKTFEEAYKSWRNKARKVNADLLLSMILDEMQRLPDRGMDLVKAAPWQLMLMAKWVCQDEHAHNTGGRELTGRAFWELRNEIWNFDVTFPDGGFDLVMRRLFRPQMAFQRRPSLGFLRDLSLISGKGSSHIRREFESKAGVSVEAFIDLSIALSALIISGSKVIRFSDLAPLAKHHGHEAMEGFLSCVSATWSEMKEYCRSLPDAKKKVASELYELPALTRYPLVRLDYGFRSWHPMCFYRGMDEIFHHVMGASSFNYMEQFGKFFEQHAMSMFEVDGYRSIDNSELEKMSGGHEFCDGALISESCQLLVEIKTSIYSEDVLVAGSKEYFSRNTKQLLKAINQGVSTVRITRSAGLTSDVTPTFMLIVLNKRIGMVDANRYVSMIAVEHRDKCSVDRQLPMENVFFLHIDDYEMLMEWLKKGEVDPLIFPPNA